MWATIIVNLSKNGSCVQPNFAIIANTSKGSQIVHEDFLSDNFVIDTINNEKGGPFIYGYYYECANKKKIKSYRIRIE